MNAVKSIISLKSQSKKKIEEKDKYLSIGKHLKK